MRTIGLIPDIPKNTDTEKFPDGGIVNATETIDGTPVIEEIYNDILVNFYKLLRITGGTANNLQDNELNGYQIISALQKLANTQNDVEQQLDLSGSVFSIGLDLSKLPEKYFCFARATAAFTVGVSYTFEGTDGNASALECLTGFAVGDDVLLIIDPTTTRAIRITQGVATSTEVFTVFGTPLSYNDSNKIWYQESGNLYSDLPEIYDLQAAIRLAASDGTLLVYEMIMINGYVLCLVFKPDTLTYRFYNFSISSLATPVLVTIAGATFPTGSDNQPNVYCDGTHIYISNSTGNSANNYQFDVFSFNMAAGTLTKTGTYAVDTAFDKTTNAVVSNSYVYTYVAGVLVSYHLSTGSRSYLATYPGFIGVIFNFNGFVYYSNGEVAKKWTLPFGGRE